MRPRWRLRKLPGLVEQLVLGQVTEARRRNQRVTNRRFKVATGWRPAVPDAYQGWQRLVARSTAGALAASAR